MHQKFKMVDKNNIDMKQWGLEVEYIRQFAINTRHLLALKHNKH